jgi:mono/diheme cytochrome c family protein
VAASILVLALPVVAPRLLGAGQEPTGRAGAATVWDGVFTAEQAARGQQSYSEHCAGCHGASLEGGEYRALTGDRFWTSWQGTTVDRLLGQISTTMPHSEDGSLKGTLGARAYADIVAHILSSNGFPAGPRELTVEAVSGVRIVPKDGSNDLPAGSFVHVVGCLARGEKPGQWKVQRAAAPVRVFAGDAVDAAGTPLGTREFALLFVITPLDRFVGHRVSVRGSLVGANGADGVNVTTVASASETCQ